MSVRGAVERVGGTPTEEWAEGPGSRFWNNSLAKIAWQVDASFDAYDPRKAVSQIAEFIRGVSLTFFRIATLLTKLSQTGSFRCRNPGTRF